MNLMISLNHPLEIAKIIHIQQWNNMGIPVSDMSEYRYRHMLPLEELFQIPNQLTDPFGAHDNVVHKIDRLLLRIESIECRVQRFSCLPKLFPPFRIKRQSQLRRKREGTADSRQLFPPLMKIRLEGIGIQFNQ